MDKRVIFAVAGAGKTTYIINCLALDKRALIITYTENNYHNLRRRVIQKFGLIPENITILTYYNFLYSFCYKPFLHDKIRAKGINWTPPPPFTLRLKRSDMRFYMDSLRRLYSNRIAKLVAQMDVVDNIVQRLSKYYDQFFVDEVQDFGGHDFNLLIDLCTSELDINFVGDFYQHTFDTSRDGVVNKALYDNFEAYKSIFEKVGMTADTTTLSHSYRCTPAVCQFITEKLWIEIHSHKEEQSEVKLISEPEEVMEKFNCENTVKLFFQNHAKYPCFSQNWGKSKGQDHYGDVLVMLYPAAMKAFKDEKFNDLPASSRNKLYVACTRANNNLYFAEEALVRKYRR